jgi:hypothetical protein
MIILGVSIIPRLEVGVLESFHERRLVMAI